MMQNNCNCNNSNNWQNQGMNRNGGRQGGGRQNDGRMSRMKQRGNYGMDYSCGSGGDEPNTNPCYHKELPVDRIKPGMGYVPWQNFENVLGAKEGMKHGTIFSDLILPFYGSAMQGNSGDGRRCR